MGYDQTACLVAVAQFAAEDHTRGYHKCRNLTQERENPIKTTNTEKDSKSKVNKNP